MKIGVFGGTFDPPHLGHLIIAMWVCDEFAIDRVIFVPAYKQPLKLNIKISPFEHRANMVALSIQGVEKFQLSNIEFDKGGISYTVNLLRSMKEIYPKDELLFLMGADSLSQIKSWFEWERIWDYALPIVFPREGFDIETERKRINKPVLVSNSPLIAISSTMIRERIASGLPIKYLVHPDVEKYIYRNGLYK